MYGMLTYNTETYNFGATKCMESIVLCNLYLPITIACFYFGRHSYLIIQSRAINSINKLQLKIILPHAAVKAFRQKK